MSGQIARRALAAALLAQGAAAAAAGGGALPVTGKPVPELAVFDDLMVDFMNTNGIPGAVLGVMKDGVIVYQRGFGWKDSFHTESLRHDALLRVASVTKPMVAAAIQKLVASGDLAFGDKAFDLGQPGGGVLTIAPAGPLGDARLKDVTIGHLLAHQGGWDRDAPGANDLIFSELEAAGDLGVNSPPSRAELMSWILTKPLEVDPGVERNYSNVGFLALGLIIEEVTGEGTHAFVRDEVFGPLPWTPRSDLIAGQTFTAHPREPVYTSFPALAPNVFWPFLPPLVSPPYGAWNHEAMLGNGGMVTGTALLLQLAEAYYLNRSGSDWQSYGAPVTTRSNRSHDGLLVGTEARVVQRDGGGPNPGVNYAFIFNAWNWSTALGDYDDWLLGEGETPAWFNTAFKDLMEGVLGGSPLTWPAQGVDGEWVQFATSGAGSGAYEDPYRALNIALPATPDEGTLNFRPGGTTWTGVITQKVRLRAHGGSVVIGS